MAVFAGWGLATHPHHLTPPPPTRPPPISAIRDITGPVKKLSQKPAVNTARQSYLWNSSYKSALLIQQILCGYNAAQENHSGFNVSKRYFSKYKMWHCGRFSQIQSHMYVPVQTIRFLMHVNPTLYLVEMLSFIEMARLVCGNSTFCLVEINFIGNFGIFYTLNIMYCHTCYACRNKVIIIPVKF